MSSGSKISSGFFLFLSVWLFCFAEMVYAQSLNASDIRDGHFPQKDLSPIYQECIGCHTPHRSIPGRGYTERKIGKWNDSQCMGCHKEFNELGQLFISNPKHEKFVMFPLPDEKLAHIAANPLGYTHAPENPGVWVDGIERITVEDLLVYLKHPMRMNAGYFNHQIAQGNNNVSEPISMPAYPTLNGEQLETILISLYPEQKNSYLHKRQENKVTVQSIPKVNAPEAWTKHCQACHVENAFSAAPVSAMNLSLYSTDWIYAYARGEVNHHRLATRTMPVFSISRNDAKAIKNYLLGMRQNTLVEVDSRIAAIQFSVPVVAEQKKNPMSKMLAHYIWNNFFLDAGCVHCHAAEGRAKQALDLSSNQAFRLWLHNNDPYELWRRLETRQHEQDLGIGASVPGMPMATSALPKEARNVIGLWVESGCIDAEGVKYCAPQVHEPKISSVVRQVK